MAIKIKHKNNRMNSRGQVIILNLLFLLMTIMVLIALVPQITVLLNIAQQSDGLNCKGYIYEGNPNNSLSYNASMKTNTMACMSIDLYLPYILLAILIAAVSRVIIGREPPQ